jgi:outer membrane biosynthesis protein TonB
MSMSCSRANIRRRVKIIDYTDKLAKKKIRYLDVVYTVTMPIISGATINQQPTSSSNGSSSSSILNNNNKQDDSIFLSSIDNSNRDRKRKRQISIINKTTTRTHDDNYDNKVKTEKRHSSSSSSLNNKSHNNPRDYDSPHFFKSEKNDYDYDDDDGNEEDYDSSDDEAIERLMKKRIEEENKKRKKKKKKKKSDCLSHHANTATAAATSTATATATATNNSKKLCCLEKNLSDEDEYEDDYDSSNDEVVERSMNERMQVTTTTKKLGYLKNHSDTWDDDDDYDASDDEDYDSSDDEAVERMKITKNKKKLEDSLKQHQYHSRATICSGGPNIPERQELSEKYYHPVAVPSPPPSRAAADDDDDRNCINERPYDQNIANNDDGNNGSAYHQDDQCKHMRRINTFWDDRYRELADYARQHGDAHVPMGYAKNRRLANWVNNQRTQYRLFKANDEKSSMTTERIELLNKIGFLWEISSKEKGFWDDRYRELADYASQHGDAHVPKGYAKNRRLANWVNNQTTQYRLFKANDEKSSMTTERIELLNKIGFRWNNNAFWDDQYRELANYASQHGDAHVPMKYAKNRTLANWVSNQRTQYRLFKANEKSSMTTEKIELLNKLGFQWKRHPRRNLPEERSEVGPVYNSWGIEIENNV